MRILLFILSGWLLLGLAGCAAAGGLGETAVSPTTLAPVTPSGEVDFSQITPEPVGTDDPVEMPQPGLPDPGRYMANLARQALANRLGVDISAVAVLEQERVEWPDSSLGCPQPGTAYLTVITPGYRLLLEVDGERYPYHTDLGDTFIFCPAR